MEAGLTLWRAAGEEVTTVSLAEAGFTPGRAAAEEIMTVSSVAEVDFFAVTIEESPTLGNDTEASEGVETEVATADPESGFGVVADDFSVNRRIQQIMNFLTTNKN